MLHSNNSTHFLKWLSIDEFYWLILSHPKCQKYNEEVLWYIREALWVADDFHKHETRKTSWMPYITHPLDIAQQEISQEEFPHWKSILTLILHDTLESHPSRFLEVFEIVPSDVFVRILKLSKLSSTTRREIHEFLSDRLQHLPTSAIKKYTPILQMLWYDEQRKKEILQTMTSHDQWSFQRLIESYSPYLNKHFPDLSQDKKDQEIDGLWHYIFFDRVDARHKFRDTLHNLSDVNSMSDVQKRKYILRRIPKLQALAFVLLRYGMENELNQLMQQWQSIWWKVDQYGQFTIHEQLHDLVGSVGEQVWDIIWE